MADETQVEAQQATDTPEGVTTTEVTERNEYHELVDNSKEFVRKFGEPDFESFMARVGSDGIFARNVVTHVLTEKFGGEAPVITGALPDSPQEHNITGKLDHTTATAKKLSGSLAEHVPPTSGTNTDTAPEK